MNIIETIKAEMEVFDKKRKEMTAELREKFPAILAPLFEKHANVNSVGWRQYTPYFNDGDECIFRVSNDYDDLSINEEDWYDLDDDSPLTQAFHDFGECFKSIPDSFYKDLFGDHVEVTVNRDGTIEVDEYDHD